MMTIDLFIFLVLFVGIIGLFGIITFIAECVMMYKQNKYHLKQQHKVMTLQSLIKKGK